MKEHFRTIVGILVFLFSWPTLVVANEDITQQQYTLVWSQSDSYGEQIYFSNYAEEGWTLPVQITNNDTFDYLPSSGISTDGTVWIVWSRIKGDDILLLYCSRVSGIWGEPIVIGTGMVSNTSVNMLVDMEDRPWIVWSGFDGEDDDIFYSILSNGRWSTPARVHSDNKVPDVKPVLSQNAQGQLTIIWKQFNGIGYETIARYWDGSGWAVKEDLVSDASGKRIGVSNTSSTPPLPRFLQEPHKASLQMLNNNRSYSIPLRKME